MRPTVLLQGLSLLPVSTHSAENKSFLANIVSLLAVEKYSEEKDQTYKHYLKLKQLRHAAAASGKRRLMEL